MITAIDFGCHKIRSACRTRSAPSVITLFEERSEYAVLPRDAAHREALLERQISFADCDNSLVVFGNRAAQVRWLSRKPCAPLFTDGGVPTTDAPARQMLHVLTQAMLPEPTGDCDVCCFTVPGGHQSSVNAEFLSRLIRIRGFEPIAVASSESATLAAAAETNFTGVTIVFGSESSEISICRYGVQLATESLAVGANWIDAEIARQFEFRIWDEHGESYLDLEAVRAWKYGERVHLRNGIGEREKMLSRLYGAVFDQMARSVRELFYSSAVKSALGNQRLAVVCAGGPTQIGGFGGALTERFVDHDIASEILSVRTVEDPSNAVVRGLLIHGELEQRRLNTEKSAA